MPRLQRLALWVLVFILVPSIIDWPPLVEFRYPGNLWHSLPALLFPAGWLLVRATSPATATEPAEVGAARDPVVDLLVGLCFGGALWLQVVADLLLLPILLGTCGEPQVPPCLPSDVQWDGVGWEYLGGHVFDVFAIAAIITVGGYITRHGSAAMRSAWLAIALTVAAGLSGLTETAILNEHHVLSVFEDGSADWILIPLWALTGTYYGLIVGITLPAGAAGSTRSTAVHDVNDHHVIQDGS